MLSSSLPTLLQIVLFLSLSTMSSSHLTSFPLHSSIIKENHFKNRHILWSSYFNATLSTALSPSFSFVVIVHSETINATSASTSPVTSQYIFIEKYFFQCFRRHDHCTNYRKRICRSADFTWTKPALPLHSLSFKVSKFYPTQPVLCILLPL